MVTNGNQRYIWRVSEANETLSGVNIGDIRYRYIHTHVLYTPKSCNSTTKVVQPPRYGYWEAGMDTIAMNT